MDDVFFRTFVHNSCNEIYFSVMSECFDYFGVVGCSFRTTVAGGWCRLLGSFIALSYVHHVDCAYINSSEKVDDPCSWFARSILQLPRQLIEGPVSIGQRPGRRFETCMIYELEKMWISKSTQLCMDTAGKSTYGEGRGHICRAFHVG
jgi:hypothetical protein